MGNFIKKSWIAITSTTLLTPVAFVAVSVAAPGIASARCAGVGSEVRSTLVVNGTELVAEAPDAGTCNSNNLYTGHFAAKLPGLHAWVLIQNNDRVVAFSGNGFNTLNNDYSFTDNNSHSAMSLCVDDSTTIFCGWGTAVVGANFPVDFSSWAPNIPAGINSGF
jgi:hypothetical protein